jgi:predicted RNA-binding protein YlqC (UPF0109 family)
MDNVNVDVSDEVVADEYEDMLPAEEEFSAAYPVDSDAAERLRGLIVYLATNLVDDPNTVEVEARQRGGSVFVSLRVPEEELGKVIGRGGRIARAMRTALMISGSRSNVRASLDIED